MKKIEKQQNFQKGFTIIEIMVVIAVLGIVGVMITEIFFNTIKGSNKSSLITRLKQNGQSALELIDKEIRNADSIACPIVPSGLMSKSSDILIIRAGSTYKRFSFITPAGGKNPYLAVDSIDYNSFTSAMCDEVEPSAVNITDKTSVKVTKGTYIFTRTIAGGFRDVVSIEFSVAPGNDVPATLSSQVDPVPFATSVQLRNIN